MISKSRTIIKIIIFLIINGAILDESKAIKKSAREGPSASPVEDKHYPKFPALSENPEGKDCYRNLTTECKSQTVDAICQHINVPVDHIVSGYCCNNIWSNLDEHCFFDVLVKDLQNQDPCKKDPCATKVRADEVWYYCVNWV